MKAKLTAAELRVLDTPQAREQEVQSGRADVFMTDYPFSRRMLDNSDWARLVSPVETYHITPYAWAMQPGDDAFHARVEEILSAMKRDGRLLANARRYGLDPLVVK
jgi:ABC-type amino acid transport substrate-binding protein